MRGCTFDTPLDVPLMSGDMGRISFREQDDQICCMGQMLSPRRCPIYIPEWLESFGKPFTVPPGSLYRAAETDGKWVFSSKVRCPALHVPGDCIDLILFPEEAPQVVWLRLMGTDDPFAEDAAQAVFFHEMADGRVTVTGVSQYSERVHIPAALDGCPVTGVRLPAHRRSEYLRELVVAEGIHKIAADLSSRHLETIRIPESTILAAPPDGIQNTRWFAAQPDGPVYFHGYYCGSKGVASPDVLEIRDGTVGIVALADIDRPPKRVVLPNSVQYIGAGAFGVVDHGAERSSYEKR